METEMEEAPFKEGTSSMLYRSKMSDNQRKCLPMVLMLPLRKRSSTYPLLLWTQPTLEHAPRQF